MSRRYEPKISALVTVILVGNWQVGLFGVGLVSEERKDRLAMAMHLNSALGMYEYIILMSALKRLHSSHLEGWREIWRR